MDLISPDIKINWQQIIFDLQRQGLSIRAISTQLNTSTSTVIYWRDHSEFGFNPPWDKACTLLRVYFDTTGKKTEEVPQRIPRPFDRDFEHH